jgi:sugar/nucleoside kinase (ribokinase family)
VSRIVVLGDVMVDVVVRLSGPLAQASDSPAEIRFRGGGSAANTAEWLGAAGAEVTLVGRVGDDERGRSAVEALRVAGVDTRIALDPERPTGTCLVLIEPGGERTMAPDAGANDGLAVEEVPDDLLAEAAHLHVSGYALLREGSRAAARAAIEGASRAGLAVSVDPSSAALLDAGFLDLAEGAGLLLPNASEAHALTGDSDPEAAGRALAKRFGEVVVTLGPGGALWTGGDEVLRAAAVEVGQVEDSAGAGDAFAAGFLKERVSGASTAEALAAGCRLAARAVRGAGARP